MGSDGTAETGEDGKGKEGTHLFHPTTNNIHVHHPSLPVARVAPPIPPV